MVVGASRVNATYSRVTKVVTYLEVFHFRPNTNCPAVICHILEVNIHSEMNEIS